MMPRLDGFGLQTLRGDPSCGVPVVVLSARAGESQSRIGAGGPTTISSPFSARELLARVAANIELSRTRLQSERILPRAREDARDRGGGAHRAVDCGGGGARKAEGRFRLFVEGVVDYAIYMLDPEGSP
jgi:DNA-binding response OmpR family regulator